MINLLNKRYGRLVVIGNAGSNKHKARLVLCICNCGVVKQYVLSRLKAGKCKSCGCFKSERQADQNRKLFTTHGYAISGKKHSLEYRVWQGMKYRCYSPSQSQYKNYGGRGIQVCNRWNYSFINFLADMGPAPSEKHSIDRIDVNGEYSPENCRWATGKEQCRNRRNNRLITVNRETKTLAEWSELSGTRYQTIRRRLEEGWPPEQAVFVPKYGRRA